MAKPNSALPSPGPRVFGETYQRILGWFFAFPDREISLTDLCSAAKVSKSMAGKIVRLLEREGFLRVKAAGRAWMISAVRGHAYFTTRKIAANLALVCESGLTQLIRERARNARAIVLFGSYRSGDDLPSSDIDIGVEIAGDLPMKIVTLGTFPRFGYRENVKVNLHIFSRKNVDINVFANIANGIVLDGFLEVRP